MININTWFFIKSPSLEHELSSQSLRTDSIEFLDTAKIITNKCFQEAIELRRVLNNLSSYEKEEYIDGLAENILKESPQPFRTTINNNLTSVKSVLRGLFFPELEKNLKNEVAINLCALINLLERINNDVNVRYIDIYSIFQLISLFAFVKIFHHETEQVVIPSKNSRKTVNRKLKKTKKLLIQNDSNFINEDDPKVVLVATVLKSLIKSEDDEVIIESILNSKVQSLNLILRLIPERIMTWKEILDGNSIAFKKTKSKNYILYEILQNLYPEREYPSINKFPIDFASEEYDIVKQTVRQIFY